jgi:hypothetical protein
METTTTLPRPTKVPSIEEYMSLEPHEGFGMYVVKPINTCETVRPPRRNRR